MITTILPASPVVTVAKSCVRGALLIAALFAIDHAFAGGKVYRCGNVFQDQPCAAAPATAAAVANSDRVAAHESAAASGDRKAATPTGAADRPVAAPPRGVTIEARR